ncbi:uncharacterized protein LOC131949450 [Physella acuta]|uniref:uncharacterized protein LOC131949450 n=1 Tax=Physella acuta TaxID=109671 RepID=UPI0027DAD2D9|nr:uncharacterized protein LOC131949450 [Physella acuta]
MKSLDNDFAQRPLCEASHPDDVTTEEERRDDVAVLSSENGLTASRPLHGKRSLYLVHQRLPKLNCRWRQGAVLGLGILLTIVALTLVVVGAVRSREHSTLKFIHVKQPIDLKALMYLGDENFTFAQLVSLRNVAVDKNAFQSSVSKRDQTEEAQGLAGRAVDGDVTSCSATGLERSPVWFVDLQSVKVVRSVRILGSSVNKLHDIQVYVSPLSNVTTETQRCGQLGEEAKLTEARVACDPPLQGRYVIIQLQTRSDTYESLVLCEVMVFL